MSDTSFIRRARASLLAGIFMGFAMSIAVPAIAQEQEAGKEPAPDPKVASSAPDGYVTINGILKAGQCIALERPDAARDHAPALICNGKDGILFTGEAAAAVNEEPEADRGTDKDAPTESGILTQVTIIDDNGSDENGKTGATTQVIIIDRSERYRGDVLQIIRDRDRRRD